MNEINFLSCVLNSRVRVGTDIGTIKFIGEVNKKKEKKIFGVVLMKKCICIENRFPLSIW